MLALTAWALMHLVAISVDGCSDEDAPADLAVVLGSPFEAEAMKRYLVEHGVPADAVVEDRGGENTYLTARFTADYMQQHGLRSVIAVSQYYHISRSKLALRRFGIAEVRGAHAAMVLEPREPWSLLRELVGYYTYLFKDHDAG